MVNGSAKRSLPWLHGRSAHGCSDRCPGGARSVAVPLVGHMSTVAVPCSTRSARRACWRPARRVLAMLSGGADSVCLVHASLGCSGPDGVTRCTSTTGCATRPARTSASASSSASGSAWRCTVERVRPERRAATSRRAAREARYAAAERVRQRAAGPGSATGHTADRPGGDGAVPAGLLARPAGAAGDARRAAGPGAPAARRSTASRHAPTAPSRGWSGGRTRPTRTEPSRATACGSTSLPALRADASGRRAQRPLDGRAAERGGGRCWTRPSTRRRSLAAPGAPACRRSRRGCASWRRPLRRLMLRRLAEQAAGGPLPLDSAAWRRSSDWRARGGSG